MMQAFLGPLSPEHLRCLGCGTAYAIVHGFPVVLPVGVPHADAQDEALVRAMEGLPACPLQALLREQVASLRPPVLDMGCGIQDWGRPDILGLDARLSFLKRRGGPGVVGDAQDPPFAPESFSAVCLFNLLDSVPNPVLVLAWADALLVPGGELLVAMPFAWSDVVPERLRFDWDTLVACLEGRSQAMGLRLRYAVHSQWRDVAWSGRGQGEPAFAVQVLRATKGPPPTLPPLAP